MGNSVKHNQNRDYSQCEQKRIQSQYILIREVPYRHYKEYGKRLERGPQSLLVTSRHIWK